MTKRSVSIGSHAAPFATPTIALSAIGIHGAGAPIFAPPTRTFGPEAAHRLILTMLGWISDERFGGEIVSLAASRVFIIEPECEIASSRSLTMECPIGIVLSMMA
ncbi:MAG: hypothetical protein ACR2OU_09715 [Thermomicrobiales bacterium]